MRKLLIVVIGVFITGCAPRVSHNTITLEHKLGTTEITENPKKVIVFDMGILEILDDAGVEVYGVPKQSLTKRLENYQGSKYLDAGTLFEPDFESIANASPDLIIISGRASKNFDTLSEIAPTVFLGTGSRNDGLLASIEANIEDLKLIFPKASFDSMLESMTDSLETLKDKTASLNGKAMFLLANGDSISSYGPGSRYDHVFNEFGFEPVDETFKDSTHGDNLSFELVAKINPDYLIVMDRGAIAGSDVSAASLLDNDYVKMTKAYQNDKIIFVDPETWYLTEGGIGALERATKELLIGLD